MATLNNQEQNNETGKTLIVNPQLHEKLLIMKIRGKFKSIDELISDLVEKQEKKEKRNGKQ
jgi:hypothetical protein